MTDWAAVRVRRAQASGRCADARAAKAVADTALTLFVNCDLACSPRAVRAFGVLQEAYIAAESLVAGGCAGGGPPGHA